MLCFYWVVVGGKILVRRIGKGRGRGLEWGEIVRGNGKGVSFKEGMRGKDKFRV